MILDEDEPDVGPAPLETTLASSWMLDRIVVSYCRLGSKWLKFSPVISKKILPFTSIKQNLFKLLFA